MGELKGKLTPGENLEKLLSELEVGEVAYTDPSNLEFNITLSTGYLFLNTSSSESFEEGYRNLYVKRTGEGKNDYFVDISTVEDYKFERSPFPLGKEEEELYSDPKVAVIHYSKTESEHPKEKSIDEQIEDAINNEDFKLAAKLRDQKNSKK